MKLLFCLVAGAGLGLAQQPCEQLKSLNLPGLTMASAVSVPAGSFTPPGTPARPVQVAAFCRVSGVLWPEISFELWLPAQWNKKLLAVGNGGLAGSISYAAMTG